MSRECCWNTSRGATGNCPLTSLLLTLTTYLDQSSVSTGVQLHSTFSHASTEVPERPSVSAFVLVSLDLLFWRRLFHEPHGTWWRRTSHIFSSISSNSWAQHSVLPQSRLTKSDSLHCQSFTGRRTAWGFVPVMVIVSTSSSTSVFLNLFSLLEKFLQWKKPKAYQQPKYYKISLFSLILTT